MVADALLDGAAVPLQLRAQPRVVGLEDADDVLGIYLLGAGGEPDEVGEEHGDDLSLLAGGHAPSLELEDLCQDLADGRQRVELALLHLIEQPCELGVVRHRALEVGLRPRGGDREDLGGEIAAAAFLASALALEEGAVLLDLLPELWHVLAALRLGQQDRQATGAV